MFSKHDVDIDLFLRNFTALRLQVPLVLPHHWTGIRLSDCHLIQNALVSDSECHHAWRKETPPGEYFSRTYIVAMMYGKIREQDKEFLLGVLNGINNNGDDPKMPHIAEQMCALSFLLRGGEYPPYSWDFTNPALLVSGWDTSMLSWGDFCAHMAFLGHKIMERT